MAALIRTDDGTLEITISIPWSEVKTAYDKAVDEAVKKAELPGFRQGKAPREMVEKSLDENKVYEEAIRHLIPAKYEQSVRELNIRPVMYPQIELKEAKAEHDWTVLARTCEKPVVTLDGYKEKVADLNTSKQKKIWVPGAKEKPDEKDGKPPKPTLDEIIDAILTVAKVGLPGVMVAEEINRLLSDLIDQTKKLGLSVDQYLASTKRTTETLRKEYEEQARKSLSAEFILEDIAESEKISVSDEDIEKTIAQAKTEEEKKAMAGQKYYLATILRRRKTLDYLASL